MAGILDIIHSAADRQGLDADYLARVAKIESSLNPRAQDPGSSYSGLFQLSRKEFQTHGGRDIYDPEQNANAAAAMMARQRDAFSARYGRPPTPTEAYMIHQQGAGGVDQHLANPEAPAWQNMYATGEGQQKGQDWAKRAIWGNIPNDIKGRFGNVNNVTSADLFDIYRNKIEPGSVASDAPVAGSPAGMPVQATELPLSAGAMGAQTTPAGVPMWASQQPATGPGSQAAAQSAVMGQLGQKLMASPDIPFPKPYQFQPLQQPQLLPPLFAKRTA